MIIKRDKVLGYQYLSGWELPYCVGRGISAVSNRHNIM